MYYQHFSVSCFRVKSKDVHNIPPQRAIHAMATSKSTSAWENQRMQVGMPVDRRSGTMHYSVTRKSDATDILLESDKDGTSVGTVLSVQTGETKVMVHPTGLTIFDTALVININFTNDGSLVPYINVRTLPDLPAQSQVKWLRTSHLASDMMYMHVAGQPIKLYKMGRVVLSLDLVQAVRAEVISSPMCTQSDVLVYQHEATNRVECVTVVSSAKRGQRQRFMVIPHVDEAFDGAVDFLITSSCSTRFHLFVLQTTQHVACLTFEINSRSSWAVRTTVTSLYTVNAMPFSCDQYACITDEQGQRVVINYECKKLCTALVKPLVVPLPSVCVKRADDALLYLSRLPVAVRRDPTSISDWTRVSLSTVLNEYHARHGIAQEIADTPVAALLSQCKISDHVELGYNSLAMWGEVITRMRDDCQARYEEQRKAMLDTLSERYGSKCRDIVSTSRRKVEELEKALQEKEAAHVDFIKKLSIKHREKIAECERASAAALLLTSANATPEQIKEVQQRADAKVERALVQRSEADAAKQRAVAAAADLTSKLAASTHELERKELELQKKEMELQKKGRELAEVKAQLKGCERQLKAVDAEAKRSVSLAKAEGKKRLAKYKEVQQLNLERQKAAPSEVPTKPQRVRDELAAAHRELEQRNHMLMMANREIMHLQSMLSREHELLSRWQMQIMPTAQAVMTMDGISHGNCPRKWGPKLESPVECNGTIVYRAFEP